MAKKQQIDRLTKENNEALACGMSYGKYKAMQPAEPIKPKAPALLYDGCVAFGSHPQRELVCAICGKVYVGRSSHRLYCSERCKGKATREMRKARKQVAKYQGGEINA